MTANPELSWRTRTWVDEVADQGFVDLTLETCKGNEFMFHILRLMHRAAQLRSSQHYVLPLHESQIAQQAEKMSEAIVNTRERLMLKARAFLRLLVFPTTHAGHSNWYWA